MGSWCPISKISVPNRLCFWPATTLFFFTISSEYPFIRCWQNVLVWSLIRNKLWVGILTNKSDPLSDFRIHYIVWFFIRETTSTVWFFIRKSKTQSDTLSEKQEFHNCTLWPFTKKSKSNLVLYQEIKSTVWLFIKKTPKIVWFFTRKSKTEALRHCLALYQKILP